MDLPPGGLWVEKDPAKIVEEGLFTLAMIFCVVVVVFFTLTDRASTIPSNIRGCQSGTWSQRGTKVNGSHHGDNPLLGPTGIQIATKSYATLQAMAPTNNKTVHQTAFTPYREQPRSTRCRLPVGRIMLWTRVQGREARIMIREGRREAKKRKKPHKDCRRDVGNEGDLGGNRKNVDKKVLVSSC